MFARKVLRLYERVVQLAASPLLRLRERLLFKREAEKALEASGMAYCIVRPGEARARLARTCRLATAGAATM